MVHDRTGIRPTGRSGTCHWTTPGLSELASVGQSSSLSSDTRNRSADFVCAAMDMGRASATMDDDTTCLYDAYLTNPHSPSNPDGIIDLSTAENHLVADIIGREIQRRASTLNDRPGLNYGRVGGSASLCRAYRDFMLRICHVDIDQGHLTLVSGAEIAIYIVLQAACKVGDTVAVTTPCYPGFMKAIRRLGLSVAKCAPDLFSDMQAPDLGKDVRAIIISNPDVPTGRCWSRPALEAIIRRAESSGKHLIVDEIMSPTVLNRDDFTSAAAFVNNRVHVVTGLSKIGMAGLRIGAIYTGVRRDLIRDLSRIAQIGSMEEQVCASLISDPAFLSTLLETNRNRLRSVYGIAADRLACARIDYRMGSAGLTVLLNLGGDSSVQQLLLVPKVLLRDLAEFGFFGRGWFRMTVSGDSKLLATAIRRLARHLRRRSPSSLLPAYTNLLKRLWSRTDQLWAVLAANSKWAESRPIHLRHPFAFYAGHLPAFAMNQIVVALAHHNIDRVNPEFDALFARGIDPDVLSGEVHPHSAHVNQSDWPSLPRITHYAESVRETVSRLLPNLLASGQINTVEMIVEHEQMHQETLIYMMAQCQPSDLRRPHSAATAPAANSPGKQRQCRVPPGIAVLGQRGSVTANDGFGWDNEYPQITVRVDEFDVMALPVSNGEFLRFMDEGGYLNATLWLGRHWKWVTSDSITHPSAWTYDSTARQWLVRTSLFEYSPLDHVLDYPVTVSFAEASAYCCYVGARIMTEPEYQRAAYGDDGDQPYPWGYLPPSAVGANLDFQRWSLRPSGVGTTESCFGVADLVGQAWEWTSSTFSPLDPEHDFHVSPAYPAYSSDFFDGQHQVVKGGSWATDANLVRPSFRNWYQDCYPYCFAKFRLVIDPAIHNIQERDIVRLLNYVDADEQKRRFLCSIAAGLMSTPKVVDSMHLYDRRGSEIYATITDLDQYYLTRTEARILEDVAGQIVDVIRDRLDRYDKSVVNVVELGAGDGRKTIPLLKRIHSSNIDLQYFPIDISEGALRSLQEKLRLCQCHFTSKLILGDNVAALHYLSRHAHRQALTLVLFLGSSIGNHDAGDARDLLESVRTTLKPGDLAMVGFDMVKSPQHLLPAYDDAQGVTAEFNYNLIRRLNDECDAQIPADAFQHYATYNPIDQRMESFLIATKQLTVLLRGGGAPIQDAHEIHFRAWEPVHVESSYKYTLDDIERLGTLSGFHLHRLFSDDNRSFSEAIFSLL